MSRIGRKAIVLPIGVEVTDSSSFVEIKGPKGVLKVNTFKNVSFKKEGNKLIEHLIQYGGKITEQTLEPLTSNEQRIFLDLLFKLAQLNEAERKV